ncbi:nucleotidyltransferase family protein [Deinococcus sp. SDU3-2]|uniref:Nucleotidyltransferase family protein n=1 Tax=Deinococcus terrestris TaxID=2651870 RepID=A0A7X1NX31_9DEIO|nr:nucleotidyltransferase family protein [Deinococcus terrestris]MPY67425.1 nucleotidyltransferase family protein [Deinococcus terrestris]
MLHPDTLPLIQAFAQAGVTCWLIGGQAVEVLCGGNVRPHDDIDFLVREAHGARAVAVLEGLGFTHAHGSLATGDAFYRRDDLLVDLVPIRDDVDPPRTVGELAPIVWPTEFLAPHAVEWAGVRVLTLTPAGHRAMKGVVAAFYGVELREKDRADLAALATLGA